MKTLVMIGTIFLSNSFSFAEEFSIHVNNGGETSDHYCGLYCVYQAGRLTQRPVSLETLIQPQRLQGKYGSTLSDLAESCAEYQIPHRYVAAASYVDVLLMDRPAITLIKNSPDSKVANHWVLLLEVGLDTARVYDPSYGVMEVRAAELQSLWGGPVLLIETERSSMNQWLWHVAKVAIILAMLGVVCLLLHAGLYWQWNPYCVLLGVSLLLVVVTQTADPASFLHNGSVVRQTAAPFNPRPVSWLRTEELLSRRDEFVVIDVRTPHQFQVSSIRGATNVPYHSSFWKNRHLLDCYGNDQPLVLYCNSTECGWAEAMARSSLLSRFTTIQVLDDGLRGYLDARGELNGNAQ